MESLLDLLKEEEKTDLPAFCDMEGYMLSAAAIKRVFHIILDYIHIHRNIKLAEYTPRGLNVREHYQCNCYLFRGVGNQVLDNDVKEILVNFIHRWS